jgi:hypothetical protein
MSGAKKYGLGIEINTAIAAKVTFARCRPTPKTGRLSPGTTDRRQTLRDAPNIRVPWPHDQTITKIQPPDMSHPNPQAFHAKTQTPALASCTFSEESDKR